MTCGTHVADQVFQERRQRALIVVIGELSRCDCVEDIAVDDIEEAEPCAAPQTEPPWSRLITFWKPARRYQGKPWSVRAAQLVAAAARASLCILDADIIFNHWELSAHSLARTLLDPLRGVLPPRAEEGEENAAAAPSVPTGGWPPACMVSLNAPRSYLSDDGIVHLFSALMMHASLGTHVHQPHGGEFSLRADFNAAMLNAGASSRLPPIAYDDSYCVQAQLITRALAEGHGPVVERLMRGKWHAKINLRKILEPPSSADGKSRIDLVTERMFDDALAIAAAGGGAASCEVDIIAAGRVYRLPNDGTVLHSWVARSRQMDGGGAVAAAAGASAAAPREGYPGVYPDPLSQQMCVLAPPITRKEIFAALKRFLRDFLARDLCMLPEACGFAVDVLPVLHCACNGGAFRVLPSKRDAQAHGGDGDRIAFVFFGADAWARATAALLRAYRDSPCGSAARRAVVRANRLSWLLGALAFLNATVAGDWGAAHERLDEYCAAFRAAYVAEVMRTPPAH